MWIRSQDKKELLKCDRIFVEGYNIKVELLKLTDSKIFTVGSYLTEERALDVLSDIESNLYKDYAYEMPLQ